jgi:hypothetical protein
MRCWPVNGPVPRRSPPLGMPRRPVLEVRHRPIGQIGPEHVPHRLRVEHAADWTRERNSAAVLGLAAAKGPIQRDDHVRML